MKPLKRRDARRVRYLHDVAQRTCHDPDCVEGRTESISEDDIVNLRIALATCDTFEEFLASV